MHGALSDQKQHSEKIRCHQYGGGRGGLLLSLIIPFLQKEVLSIMLKGRGKHYSPTPINSTLQCCGFFF
jgi:hypothetical protein